MVGAVQVFIAAEDHPPPHVHVWHPGERWRARFRFSFLSEIAGLYGVRVVNRRPRARTLTMIEDAVIENLALCRAAWWSTHGTAGGIGLVNRRAEIRMGPHGPDVRVSLHPPRNAVVITAAGYQPDAKIVHLLLENGQALSLAAGQHIEEAEQWS